MSGLDVLKSLRDLISKKREIPTVLRSNLSDFEKKYILEEYYRFLFGNRTLSSLFDICFNFGRRDFQSYQDFVFNVGRIGINVVGEKCNDVRCKYMTDERERQKRIATKDYLPRDINTVFLQKGEDIFQLGYINIYDLNFLAKCGYENAVQSVQNIESEKNRRYGGPRPH